MNPVKAPAPPAERTRADSTPPVDPPRYVSADLFRGAREVLIEHEGDLYRLHRTSKGKLILTK